MLGDKVIELSGRTTGTRVLPGGDYRYVKMEVSFEASGKVFGADGMGMGTFTVFERVPGQMYAEGQGLIGSADGEGAIWNGHGIGHPTGNGMGMSMRYSVAYQAGQTGKFAALNGALVIGEFESQDDGTFTIAEWLWK